MKTLSPRFNPVQAMADTDHLFGQKLLRAFVYPAQQARAARKQARRALLALAISGLALGLTIITSVILTNL